MARTAVMVALALAVPSTAFAHRDWAGDVHPIVSVEGGRFVITFENNREEKSYQTVLSTSGNLEVKRMEVSGWERPSRLDVVARDEGHTFEFERGAGTTIRHTTPCGTVRTFELDWGAAGPDFVADAAAEHERLIVLAFWKGGGLKLARFDVNGKLASMARIGDPESVYSFPHASRLARFEGGYLVAWLARDDRSLEAPRPLNLTAWNAATNALRTVTIDPKVNGNTTPSVGVIDHDVLVSWHAPTDARRGSVIRWLHLHGFPRAP